MGVPGSRVEEVTRALEAMDDMIWSEGVAERVARVALAADAVGGDRPDRLRELVRSMFDENGDCYCDDPHYELWDELQRSGGGAEPSREDRSDLDIPFRRDEPDREMVRELGDRHTFPSGSIGERAILTLQEDVDTLAEDKRELEARVAELEAALRPFAEAYERVEWAWAPDDVPIAAFEGARAALAAAGEGDGPRCETSAHDAIVEAYRQSGSRLPEQES